MKLKNLLLILTILFLSWQNAFAENWMPISSDVYSGESPEMENFYQLNYQYSYLPQNVINDMTDMSQYEKLYELDLDSITRDGNIITYTVKTNFMFEYNKDLIYKISTNMEDKTSAILDIKIFEDGQLKKHQDLSKKPKYKSSRGFSALENVVTILSYLDKNPNESVNPKVWKKYFKKYQRQLQKNWHPNNINAKHYPKRAIVYVTLVIDKNGKVVYQCYKYTNKINKYDDFFAKLEKMIENDIKKFGKFDPLPKEFQGRGVVALLKFEYSYEYDAANSPMTWNNVGIGYMELGKNASMLVALGGILWTIIKLPFEFLFILLT